MDIKIPSNIFKQLPHKAKEAHEQKIAMAKVKDERGGLQQERRIAHVRSDKDLTQLDLYNISKQDQRVEKKEDEAATGYDYSYFINKQILLVLHDANFANTLARYFKQRKLHGFLLDDSTKSVRVEAFDILITDLDITKEENAAFIVKLIKAAPQISSIYVSSFMSHELWKKARALGCFDVVLKSFRIDNFLMMVEKALKRIKK
jgi:CheY-like chemotaxis protein